MIIDRRNISNYAPGRVLLASMFLFSVLWTLTAAFASDKQPASSDDLSQTTPYYHALNLLDSTVGRKQYDPLSLRRASVFGPPLSPNAVAVNHTIGTLELTKTNFGQFRLAEFPRYSSHILTTQGGLWIGAILERDTLVTTGIEDSGVQEFWPTTTDSIIRMSINKNDEYFNLEALSEQDLLAVYYDTLTDPNFVPQDEFDNRPHRSLNLKIVERSMQWSYEYASDFVLFDYQITNIGLDPLIDTYIGVYIESGSYCRGGDNINLINGGGLACGRNNDEIYGFMETVPADCGFEDSLRTQYVRDNDGDPIANVAWSAGTSLRNIAGVRVLRGPNNSLRHAYNWWIVGSSRWDFGPRKAGTQTSPFRDMNGFLGTPYGDKNKYSVMRNQEVDYNQIEMLIDHTAEGWLPPGRNASIQSQGSSVRFLTTVGPVTIFPGETVPFTFAFIAGSNVHTDPGALRNLFNPLEPEAYLNTLDFSDFILNARWADWIYDNPGIDTDNDGNRGKTRECVLRDSLVIDTSYLIDSSFTPWDSILVVDTTLIPVDVSISFYAGDGIPDFRGASPPPAPIIRVLPEEGKLTIRWNGYASENTPDPFSDEIDFEGYRVYTALTNAASAFVVQTSYDVPNYSRYTFNLSSGEYELLETPFTLEQLQAIYGSEFLPQNFPADNPLLFTDPITGINNIYYFTNQSWNQDQLNQPGTIAKRFPDAPRPVSNPNLWTEDELTDEGLPKYYEYEFVIDGLLPSVPLYCSVTAFDYGSPRVNLPSLETNPSLNAVREFPLVSSETSQELGLPVIVYPNPYRIDGDYRAKGFEGRDRADFPVDRTRAINFINLPLVCTISIYSIDGDLVRQVIHDMPNGGPGAMHDSWDVISRNLLPVVSGIYYWVVEVPNGQTQMGKLVIIM